MSEDARSGLYDVVCQDEHKRVFIVEMQVENYDDLLERLQFYGFHIFTSMAIKGKQGFTNMGKVNCICIIKGAITDSTKYHQIINLKNEDNEIVMDNITFHLLDLGKFPTAKKVAKETTEKKATESVKKLLLRGKATIEEIAEDINVSIAFVKEIQKSMNLS